jgi:hypothetical protein
MRHCPTLPGDERPLIAHSIVTGVCQQRQREFYHKCHRCVYAGKPADFVLDPPLDTTHRNGRVTSLEVDVDPAVGAAVEPGQTPS